MPKPTNKKPKAQVGCVRFNDLIGSMHLTAPGSVVVHETDAVHYATVIPRRNKKAARSLARFFNMSEEERVEKLAKALKKPVNAGLFTYSLENGPDALPIAYARACIKAMEGA